MKPHSRDAILWWIGAGINTALMVFETALYARLRYVMGEPQLNTLAAMFAFSLVLSVVCVRLARSRYRDDPRKPPFRRPM